VKKILQVQFLYGKIKNKKNKKKNKKNKIILDKNKKLFSCYHQTVHFKYTDNVLIPTHLQFFENIFSRSLYSFIKTTS